jgi:hypothetical protein
MGEVFNAMREADKDCWQQVLDIRAAIAAAQEQGE